MLQNSEIQRSRLYHMAPIGIGTGDVESITSYIVRLAESHKVPVRKIIENVSHSTGVAFRPYLTNQINGFGDRTDAVLRYVQDSTLHSDLSALTFLNLSNAISTVNLMKKHFAWCPECLRTAVSNDKRPYHKLLWSLKAVKCCHVHGVWLQSKCPNPKCRKNNSEVINVQSTLQCPSCGHNLYDVDLKKIGQAPKDTVKRTLDLANLVQVVQDQPTHITTILKNLLELSTNDTWNGIHKVAEKSGIDRYIIEKWFTGETKPQLDYLLTISESYSKSKSISELLIQTKPLDDSNSTIPGKTRYQAQDRLIQKQKIKTILLHILHNRTKVYTPNEIVKESGVSTYILTRHFSGIYTELTSLDQVLLRSIQDCLTNLLDSGQRSSSSLKQIAKKFGINAVTLRRHFPDLCAQIASTRRHQPIDPTRLSSIHEYLTNLVSSDDLSYPSLQQIANQFKIGSTTLHHHFPELCSQISSTRRHQPIHPNRLSSIQEYLTRLVNSDNRPYPSLQQIANQFEISISTLRRHFPDLCAPIASTRRHQPIDPTRLSSIHEYLTNLVSSDDLSYPSLQQIANQFKIGSTTLHHHFPELCSQISSTRRHQPIDPNRLFSIHEYLTRLVTSDNRPYPSLQQIANQFKIGSTTLHHHFPELCSQISSTRRHQPIDPNRLSFIHEYLTKLVDSDNRPYPSIRQIAKQFEISISSLRRHFPDIYTKIASIRRRRA